MASKMSNNKKGVKRKGPPKQEEVPSSEESEFEWEGDEEEEEEEEEESSEDENTGDESDDEQESDSDASVDIDEMGDNIDLKEISDDEALGDELDTDNDDLFTEVLRDNDKQINVTDDKEGSKHQTKSISHETKPIQSGGNIVKLDEYEHDSSDEEDVLNTIGNIPYDWYKDYVHIGYDVNGRKIIKPPKEDEIDEFLRKMDDPTYWRTVRDHLTGQKVVLSNADCDLIQRIHNAKCPDPTYDPYAPFIDFFTYEKMIHPVTNQPETKASFIPSISEKRLVSKLVTAIRRSRQKPKPKPKKDHQFNFSYDLWEDETNAKKNNKRTDRYIAAPKAKPPGHEESYNPPPEYLFNDEEKKQWLEQEPEERRLSYLPQAFSSLRQVPAYAAFTKERFERSLDLYLCPRARKNRVHVNPEDLIPQLPKPADLQPFPAIQSMVYLGHQGKVLSVSVEPSGQFFVSGDSTGLLKIFEVLTGRCMKTVELPGAVTCVSWYPLSGRCIISAVVDKEVYLINTSFGHSKTIAHTEEYFAGYTAAEGMETNQKEDVSVDWTNVDATSDPDKWAQGIRVVIGHQYEIAQLTWHNGGEYFATVMPSGANKSVVIHHLSKRKSQVPFKKSKDIIKSVQFHPTRAYFFVATKKSVRIYDLIKQDLSKKLMVNTSEVSCLAVHPGGDNVLIGGVDPKVQWFDMDLSTKAYKTLRYHKKSVRSVQFHSKYPLFASASDDGTVVVCHGMVYDDLLQNALIVPVKVLKAPKDSSAMVNCTFHPIQPWLFACSSNTIRLFT